MGVIRGGLVSVICIVLLLSLLLMTTAFVLTSSLKYENVKKEISPLIKEMASGDMSKFLPEDFETGESQDFNITEEFETAKEELRKNCQGKESYYFESESFNITIPCSYVNETTESFIQKGTDQLLEENYYKDYDCGFFDCVEKTGTPLSLVSKNAHDYWRTKFVYLLLASLVLALFLYFALENKFNLPIILGSLVIVSALPFLKLEGILSNFLQEVFILISKVFLGQATKVFWIMFVLGLILLIGGIVLRVTKGRKNNSSEKKGKK